MVKSINVRTTASNVRRRILNSKWDGGFVLRWLAALGTMTRFVGVRNLAVRGRNSMTTNVAITALDIRLGPAPDSFPDRTLKRSKEYRFEV
jgi:hypothetical protein